MNLQQLAVKVLSKIGVYDQESVGGVDQQNVEAGYEAIYYVLFDEGLVTWAYTDDIPARATAPIVELVATYLKPDYRIPLSPGEDQIIPLQPAAKMLRRQLAPSYVPTTTEITDF